MDENVDVDENVDEMTKIAQPPFLTLFLPLTVLNVLTGPSPVLILVRFREFPHVHPATIEK